MWIMIKVAVVSLDCGIPLVSNVFKVSELKLMHSKLWLI